MNKIAQKTSLHYVGRNLRALKIKIGSNRKKFPAGKKDCKKALAIHEISPAGEKAELINSEINLESPNLKIKTVDH